MNKICSQLEKKSKGNTVSSVQCQKCRIVQQSFSLKLSYNTIISTEPKIISAVKIYSSCLATPYRRISQ